ncbi:MAG: virulence protein RhuM/Fic/DOC family protein, partial [Candidatus Latescibacteria bacterium]|nr:virulence protein RhuM/Fic/DOC family protein [Candidatus Latescibacterota bacterium]
MTKNIQKQLVIYQGKNGAIEFRGDFDRETIWGTQGQIAEVFGIDRTVVTRHIGKILKDGEVNEKSNVQKMHIANSDKPVKFYSLDIVLAVGYRVNSSKAIEFRKWSTKILKQHLLQGFSINKKRIGQNYEKFMQAVADVKALLPSGNRVTTQDVLELINAFAGTWFSLDAYDTDTFPKTGSIKKKVVFTASELSEALRELKQELIAKKQATDLFGQERSKDTVEGIIGNVFQTAFGKDVYPSAEKKSAHLLYFMIKNHPFTDGNKRN